MVPVIVEATGGIAPQRAHMRYLARRSHGKGATDRTRYGTTRISTKSFYMYTHHEQMLVKLAVVYDALAINKQIMSAKSFTATRKSESRTRLGRARRSRKRLAC